MSDNPFVGKWSYRSFLNDPDLAAPPDGSDRTIVRGYCAALAISPASSAKRRSAGARACARPAAASAPA